MGKTKVVFICGSLEIGRNGVGDYARRLAGEIIKTGFGSAIISINDDKVNENFQGKQLSDGIEIPVLRLSASLPIANRMVQARQWLIQLNPEWLSLQFVSYSYNARGLPFGLGSRLVRLGAGYKWHMMFHELWIGIEPGKYLRTAIISKLQRFIITKGILKCLKPHVIHSHLPEYQSVLRTYGWDVKSLPLFSNIDVADVRKKLIDDGVFRVGFFNQVDSSASIVTFLIELKKQLAARNLKLELVFVGGAVTKMKEAGGQLEKLDIFDAPIVYTGFLQNDELSAALQSCSLGITPVPRHALGKSGGVAAFLLHEVPVAAPNVHPRFKENEIGFNAVELCSVIVLEPNLEKILTLRKTMGAAKNEIQLSTVAKKFLSDLI